MKTIMFFVLALSGLTLSSVHAQEKAPQWHFDYTEALQQAKSEDKPILLSFAGSDWCKPCIKLTKEVFQDKKFQAYAEDKLILILADFPRMKKNRLPEAQVEANEKLAEKFNKDGVFPLVVIINPDESIMAKTGYRPGGAENFIEYLEKEIAD